jgi:hypothetical protein
MVCEGRYCERHAKVVAVREAGAVLRAATEAAAKARDAVVEAAKALHATDLRDSYPAERAVRIACAALLAAERAESEACARPEALR